jgi:hypothetical protein
MSNFTVVSMQNRIQYYRDRISELEPPKNQGDKLQLSVYEELEKHVENMLDQYTEKHGS